MYVLIRLLDSGTFTTGISLDWRAQFASATILAAAPTMGGGVNYSGVQTTYGVYSGSLFFSRNPFDLNILVAEASVGAPTQIYVNDALLSEVTAPGVVSASFMGGFNKFEAVRSCSPLAVTPSLPLFDALTWRSLFPKGSDPFSGSGLQGLQATDPSGPV